MPWLKVDPMDAKIMFLADWLRAAEPFCALCQRHGISRKTGYKWVRRYRLFGQQGLQDRSRRPLHCPNRIPFTVQKAIIALRKRHRHWGPKKLQTLLGRQHPDWQLPSATSIYNILRREGLVKPRRRRRRIAASPKPFAPVRGPNDVWSADFKGQFKTTDGTVCYPLTIMDHASRYLLECRILPGTRYRQSRDVFQNLFERKGLPTRIRTDNGVPFASIGVGGLSRLSAWWIRLGILPERIEPGKPQQNGRHERMHRTLKKEAIYPKASSANVQQKRFDAFRDMYNKLRPHEALGQKTPSSVYRRSGKRMPKKLPKISYPWAFKTARVNQNGTIWINGHNLYLGYLLQGQSVGLDEIDYDLWDVYFGPVRLCRINKYEKERVKHDHGQL